MIFPNPIQPENPDWLQTLPGSDDILRYELENGITVLARENHNSPSVTVQGYFPAGSILDPDEKLGLANLTAAALMRGTQQRDFQAIFDKIESVGANLGFNCGTLSTSFGSNSLVEDLPLVLDLLHETLTQPSFPVDQIERLRSQYLTALAIRSQNTAAMASLVFDNLLFAGHPYSRPEDGYQATIAAITPQDLVTFHQEYYGPEGMVFAVVGALAPEALLDLVQRTFGDWHKPNHKTTGDLPKLEPLSSTVRQHTPIQGKSQTDLILGVVGPERRSPDFLAASMGNNILGQFGLMGRIGERVRDQAGLAYYAYSTLSSGLGPGAWYAGAGVDPGNLEAAIELILDEIKLITSEPVSKTELEDTRLNYIGRLPLSLESNAGVAAAMTYLERFDLGLDYYRNYPQRVAEVNREDVLLAAQTYFQQDRMVISTAGTQE